MKANLYSIFDSLAEVFNKPFTEHNNATAIRAFQEALKDNPNCRDFFLYHVGEWNDAKGVVTPFDVPKKISDTFATDAEQLEDPRVLNTSA